MGKVFYLYSHPVNTISIGALLLGGTEIIGVADFREAFVFWRKASNPTNAQPL